MTPFDELQREHEQLLEKADVSAVVEYIDRARTRAAQIGDPRERDQLRANLRYWASYVYDRNGTYPSTTLLPAAIAKSIVPPPEPDKVKPVTAQWRWLIGGALVVVIVVAILLPQFNMMSPTAPSRATPGVTMTIVNATERLRSLPTTTDLYDKPGNEPTAQLLGRLQASSQFYAIARTTDELWLKITTVDAVSGWIKATASGVTPAELGQIPSAAIVIVSSPTITHTPFPTSTPYVTPDATAAAGAGDEPTNQPTPTSIPPTPTRAVQRATPTLAGQYTPTGPIEPPNMLPLQVNYQVVTYGPSPFNAEDWVIEIQLTATGGNNHYVFWIDGQRLESDRYTVDGLACRAMSFTIGATSGGQAMRRDVTLKSPLPKCQ